jgi:hypothetical protein
MFRKRARKTDLEREGRGLAWPIVRGRYPGPRYTRPAFAEGCSDGLAATVVVNPGDLCYSRNASGTLFDLRFKPLEISLG